MPTAAEIRQKAQELRSQGQAGNLPSQASKRAFQRSSAGNGSEDKFERLLRFSLYQATALDHLQNGAIIVFVLFSEQLQKGMSDQATLWDQSKPDQPNAGEGRFVPHPVGKKGTYLMFLTVLEGIRLLPFSKDPTVASALDTLENLDVDEVLRLAVGNFAPRHASPKQGRPWVWELTIGALTPDAFKAALSKLILFLGAHKQDTLKIEPHRKGPAGLRQALWEDLRAIQAQHS